MVKDTKIANGGNRLGQSILEVIGCEAVLNLVHGRTWGMSSGATHLLLRVGVLAKRPLLKSSGTRDPKFWVRRSPKAVAFRARGN